MSRCLSISLLRPKIYSSHKLSAIIGTTEDMKIFTIKCSPDAKQEGKKESEVYAGLSLEQTQGYYFLHHINSAKTLLD